MATVVYMGEDGSLSHIAAQQFFKSSSNATMNGVSSLAGVFAAVSAGDATYGLVPIENSSSGSVKKTYDLMLKHGVSIGAELGVREKYCLCAKTELDLAKVRRVISHPIILDACSSFLESKLARDVEQFPALSTTQAARLLTDESDGTAAICTQEAAERNGRKVLYENIGNDAFMETRYALIQCGAGNGGTVPLPHDALNAIKKRSVCFAIRNEPGGLYKLLSCFALRDINVLKVETRPITGQIATRIWESNFYVEYEVPPSQTADAAAKLEMALDEFSLWKKDFGSYTSQITHADKKAQSFDEVLKLCC